MANFIPKPINVMTIEHNPPEEELIRLHDIALRNRNYAEKTFHLTGFNPARRIKPKSPLSFEDIEINENDDIFFDYDYENEKFVIVVERDFGGDKEWSRYHYIVCSIQFLKDNFYQETQYLW